MALSLRSLYDRRPKVFPAPLNADTGRGVNLLHLFKHLGWKAFIGSSVLIVKGLCKEQKQSYSQGRRRSCTDLLLNLFSTLQNISFHAAESHSQWKWKEILLGKDRMPGPF